MALIEPTVNGLTRTWELISTAIDSTTDSNIAIGGVNNKLATAYIITSGSVLMTLKLHESPDNTNWVEIDSADITGNTAYRIQQPFSYLKFEVSARTSGQIDKITILGLVD